MRLTNTQFHWTPRSITTPRATQQGATLIELMVGITVGLLTIAVATGALMASRGASGTITDASQLQQQASYAFRVMGQQLRQAGSLYLNLAPQKPAAAPIDILDPVAFETKTVDFDPALDTISGKDSPAAGEFNLVTSYRNYNEPLFPSGTANSLLRNCLGQQDSTTLIQSRFFLDDTKNELQCNGQPIIQNVADFEVRYLMQADAATGTPTLQYMNASSVGTNWQRVFGVEVCLVLYGEESIQIPDGSTYTNCLGTTTDMSATGALGAERRNKMHMLFRSVYQLRSQGLTGQPS